MKPGFAGIWSPDRERDFLLKFAKSRFAHAESTDVVVQPHFFESALRAIAAGDAILASASDLQRVNLKYPRIGRDFLAHALAARRETVALVDGVGDHDAMFAIHQIKRR